MKQKILEMFKEYPLLVVIGVIGIFLQTLPLTLSRYQADGSLFLNSAHDSLWHLSLIQEINRGWPLQTPGFAGEKLSNYHFITDLIGATFTKIGIPPFIVYYRLEPIIVSFLFILSAFLLSKTILKTKTGIYFSTALMCFGGSLGWYAHQLGLSFLGAGNTFMLDQPFEMLTNVHTYLGFSLFLLATWFLALSEKERKIRYNLISSLFVGGLYGIKAYASLVGMVGLVAVSISLVLRKKYQKSLATLIPGLILFVFLYSVTSAGSKGLVWSPGWLLIKMIEDGTRLNKLPVIGSRIHLYLSQSDFIKAKILFFFLSLIYVIGNLGVRIIGIRSFYLWLKRPKKLSAIKIFIFSATTFSLGIPLFFYQGSTPYNIIQFGQYGLLLMSLVTAVSLEKLVKAKILMVVSIVLFVTSLPTSVLSVSAQLSPDSRLLLSATQVESLNFLKLQTPSDSVILTHPDSQDTYYLIIPGIAGRRTYYSGEVFAELTNIDVSTRMSKLQEFFDIDSSDETKIAFLEHAGINYIYLNNQRHSQEVEALEKLGLVSEFENSQISILSYKKI